MDTESDRTSLIKILKLAYSGELAAAYAYRGHWKSLRSPAEITAIKQIEEDEWVHRRNIARMMEYMKVRPRMLREVRCWIVGRGIGIGCHLIGWFLPMYFAGRLESGNSVEYENAALHAGRLGLSDFESELLVMSRVEKDHELFFLGVIQNHRWLPFVSRIFKWGAPASPVAPDSVQEAPAGSGTGRRGL